MRGGELWPAMLLCRLGRGKRGAGPWTRLLGSGPSQTLGSAPSRNSVPRQTALDATCCFWSESKLCSAAPANGFARSCGPRAAGRGGQASAAAGTACAKQASCPKRCFVCVCLCVQERERERAKQASGPKRCFVCVCLCVQERERLEAGQRPEALLAHRARPVSRPAAAEPETSHFSHFLRKMSSFSAELCG